MPETLVSRRDLSFLLYELLEVEELTQWPRFQDHNRETFDAALGTARDIAEERFATHYRKIDTEEPTYDGHAVTVIPEAKAAVEALSEAGFIAAHHDYALGGMQLPYCVAQAAFSHFLAANIGTATYPFLTSAAANLLRVFASPEQQDRFMLPLLSGRFMGTMALTEPQAGSSLADIRTKAAPAGDGTYRLTGTKIFISGAEHELTENIINLVLAKIEGAPPGVKGISLFIVPKWLDQPDGSRVRNGVELQGLIHKMGWRGTTSTILGFGESRPAVGFLIGEPHHGLEYMFHMMNEARITIGLCASMLGYAAYLYALDYARTRAQGRPAGGKEPGRPQVAIMGHADIRRMLLAAKAYVEGSLALCLTCARLVDERDWAADEETRARASLLLDILTPITKSWPSDYCQVANSHAIQVLGGYGFTRDYPVEQYYRDQRLNPIHEGTNGIQAIDLLGRKVRQAKGAAFQALTAEIRATIAEAQGDNLLGDLSAALDLALKRAEEVTRQLAPVVAAEPERGLANATVYLDMLGKVVIGWLWLRQAQVASRRLDAATGDDYNFYQGKIQAARYFCRWELPQIEAQAQLLGRLDSTCLEMQDAWF